MADRMPIRGVVVATTTSIPDRARVDAAGCFFTSVLLLATWGMCVVASKAEEVSSSRQGQESASSYALHVAALAISCSVAFLKTAVSFLILRLSTVWQGTTCLLK